MAIATSTNQQPGGRRDLPERSPAIAALAAGAGIGAILVSSCCVVPLLLAGLGIGGAWLAEEGGLAASLQPYLIAIALAALTAAWGYFVLRRMRLARACASDGVCARPATPWITGALLALATFLVAGALLWGRLEPTILDWLIR